MVLRIFADSSVKFDAFFKDGVYCDASFKIEKAAFKNLESMIRGKTGNDAIFDINAKDINSYLADALPEVSATAKVFRTTAGSSKLQAELAKIDSSLPEKVKVSEIFCQFELSNT